MSTISEQIIVIEEEIRSTPLHKATEHHIGRLRAKLSRLKEKQGESKTKKGGGGGGYAVKKQGDATVVLVGPPSAGKSTLINTLTNTQSRVAPYAFTTVSVIPGMMFYRDAYIQILDVPGLIEGAETGKGRGKEVLSVIRGADLLILISDIQRLQAIQRIKSILEENGIRIDKTKPLVTVSKKLSGGLTIKSNIKQEISKETIKEIAREMGVKSAEIAINQKITIDKLIDALSSNRVYVPSLSIINKSDLTQKRHKGFDLYISAQNKKNISHLKKTVWEKLNLKRIYLVKKDQLPNKNNPLIVIGDCSLKQIAQKIGEDFATSHKKAIIWGPGSRFPAQEVSLEKKAQEGMQIRFI